MASSAAVLKQTPQPVPRRRSRIDLSMLLGIGIAVSSQRARLASAVVIALTIVKAFLIDMSTLTGVYRALSFMCLGLVLVAIGWLYQRILFRRQAPPPAAAASGG